MSEKLYKAIAVAFKINPDEFIATLKDGDDWLSEDAISDKVTELVSTKVTAAKTDSRKSGQAEQNAKILKVVKLAGFENPDNLQGSELLTAFTAWKDEQIVPASGDTPTGEMDKETLLKLPIVKSLILEAKQESGNENTYRPQPLYLEVESSIFASIVSEARAKDKALGTPDVLALTLGSSMPCCIIAERKEEPAPKPKTVRKKRTKKIEEKHD